MSKAWLLALFLTVPASADSLKAVNAQEVRVAIAAKAQHAIGVKATPDKNGWRLQLRTPNDGVAEVFDITPGTPAITFQLRLVAGMISFDISRFAGGHTYHVAIRNGAGSSSGLVYLYPEDGILKAPRRTGPTRVKFEEHEDEPAGDEIMIEKKGSL